MKPTAEAVWAAMLLDAKFAAEAPEGSPQREAMRPFIEGSVAALDELLDETLTLDSFGRAKVTFLRYCIDNNFAKVVGDVIGMDDHVSASMFEVLIETLEYILKDTRTFLADNGVTEEQVMQSQEVGLNHANQEKWRAGTLTIGELLQSQPGVILQSGN